MNERIRELEERCWEELGEEECYYTVFNREKFAELIVRECAGVCVEQRQYQPKEVYAQAVLSHFGVEE
jgi:hypothetical protein